MINWYVSLLNDSSCLQFLIARPVGSFLCLVFCAVLTLISRRFFPERSLYRIGRKSLRIVVIAFITALAVGLLQVLCQNSFDDILAYMGGDHSRCEYLMIDDYLVFLYSGKVISEYGIMYGLSQVYVFGPVIFALTVFSVISFMIQLIRTFKKK